MVANGKARPTLNNKILNSKVMTNANIHKLRVGTLLLIRMDDVDEIYLNNFYIGKLERPITYHKKTDSYDVWLGEGVALQIEEGDVVEVQVSRLDEVKGLNIHKLKV